MKSLVQPLFDGPLDIVGDVHGEFDALTSLLAHLGYQADGRHSNGRRLIFLGDLTDRGPDSPAVVDLVRTLTESGRAQCVLGNHDLNILLNHRKPENKWFWGGEFRDERGAVSPQRLADTQIQLRVREFFRTLPIALERADLRIVHACWNDEMIDVARASGDCDNLYEMHRSIIDEQALAQRTDDVNRSLSHQNRNPVKLLTSGPEERSDEPIVAGGKTRYERRVSWWNTYAGAFCVFGHYAIKDGQPRGRDSTFCADFAVAERWKERRMGRHAGFSCKLAAVRIPERQVVFDEGEIREM